MPLTTSGGLGLVILVLVLKIWSCLHHCPDDIDGDRLAEQIQDCRILVKRLAAVDFTPLGILKFIVYFWWKWRVPQFESRTADPADGVHFCCWLREWAKMKLIVTYLRSIMTEEVDELVNSFHGKKQLSKSISAKLLKTLQQWERGKLWFSD